MEEGPGVAGSGGLGPAPPVARCRETKRLVNELSEIKNYIEKGTESRGEIAGWRDRWRDGGRPDGLNAAGGLLNHRGTETGPDRQPHAGEPGQMPEMSQPEVGEQPGCRRTNVPHRKRSLGRSSGTRLSESCISAHV